MDKKSIAEEIGVSPCTVQQKIPSLNAKKFAYIKKLLYLCARNCKLGNCVTTGDQICPAISRFSDCRTTGAKIVMVSFCDSYADKDKSGVRVAQYLTELPSKKVLLRQLQKSLAVAKDLHTDR